MSVTSANTNLDALVPTSVAAPVDAGATHGPPAGAGGFAARTVLFWGVRATVLGLLVAAVAITWWLTPRSGTWSQYVHDAATHQVAAAQVGHQWQVPTGPRVLSVTLGSPTGFEQTPVVVWTDHAGGRWIASLPAGWSGTEDSLRAHLSALTPDVRVAGLGGDPAGLMTRAAMLLWPVFGLWLVAFGGAGRVSSRAGWLLLAGMPFGIGIGAYLLIEGRRGTGDGVKAPTVISVPVAAAVLLVTQLSAVAALTVLWAHLMHP